MAFSVSIVDKNVAGKNRIHVVSCSVDSASGNIDTGLSVIYGHSLGPISMNSGAPILKKNIGSGATARNGIMNINGATSGDVFQLVVWGR